MLENKKKQEEKLKEMTEKYLNLYAPASVQLNTDSLNKSRVISNIFIGISAGIFGFGAFYGVLYWLAMGVLTTIILFLYMTTLGSDARGDSKYFKNMLQDASSNMFSNIMTYMLFWIMFYNIVYVV